MAKTHLHESHPDILKRLKRAGGHLQTIIAMIEEERSCPELAQQLHAVEKAITNAKRTLIHDHIDHCLDAAIRSRGPESPRALKEFKAITQYL